MILKTLAKLAWKVTGLLALWVGGSLGAGLAHDFVETAYWVQKCGETHRPAVKMAFNAGGRLAPAGMTCVLRDAKVIRYVRAADGTLRREQP